MLKVIATFIVDPEKLEEAISFATELIELPREELGCIQYALLQAKEQENQLLIVESWDTQENLDAHSASEHFTRIVPQFAALCVEPPAIVGYKQLV